ncbi:hypothetical protein LT493_01575 [Streptomyces tricolor]|nr:hypothetical protein [Streptomyces tricolor]
MTTHESELRALLADRADAQQTKDIDRLCPSTPPTPSTTTSSPAAVHRNRRDPPQLPALVRRIRRPHQPGDARPHPW